VEDLQEVVEVAAAVGAGDPRGTLCSQALGERKQAVIIQNLLGTGWGSNLTSSPGFNPSLRFPDEKIWFLMHSEERK
jgi:hypothetical protein